jgi:hypothetical protein
MHWQQAGERKVEKSCTASLEPIPSQGGACAFLLHFSLLGGVVCCTNSALPVLGTCRMDLLRPTASVGTMTDHSVGPSDYSSCAARHLMVWGARTTLEKYSDWKLYIYCTM